VKRRIDQLHGDETRSTHIRSARTPLAKIPVSKL